MSRLFLFLLVPSICLAQPRAATPREEGAPESRYSLTLYSTGRSNATAGYGVVREVRKVPLNKGENTVRFTHVPAAIDASTVSFKSLTAPDSTSVIEQSFEYDLVDPDKLLEKYVGRNIIINRKQEPLPTDRVRMPETIEAKLLAFTKDQLVLQTNNKQLPLQIIPRNSDITEIKLFDLQGGLTTIPTLVWKISTDRAGEHDVLVSYETDRLDWRADHTLALSKDESAADFSSWVTLTNQCGASFPNAKVKLIAGQPHREAEGNIPIQRAYVVKQTSFSDYHLYTIDRPISLPNNATKQIELFPRRSNVAVEKLYVYDAGPAELSSDMPRTDPAAGARSDKKVQARLKLANNEKSGLGMPLPAGRIRVYKRDAADGDDPAGTLEFIGEDQIDHTPRDKEILCRIGAAFDVVAERKQTNFALDNDKHTMTESFEIKLANHKARPVTVQVRETLHRWHQWEITAASEKYQKRDGRTIEIPVQLAANEETNLAYTVKYTW